MHEYAGITTGIGLTANPIVNFSGVVGNNALSLGTDLAFDTASGNFIKCNAGLSFTNADLIASMTLLVDLPYSPNLHLYMLVLICQKSFTKSPESVERVER